MVFKWKQSKKEEQPPQHVGRGSLRSDDYDEWDSRFMLRSDHDDFGGGYNDKWGKNSWFKPSCIPITIILLLIVLVVLLPLLDAAEKQSRSEELKLIMNKCQQHCVFSLVETIPEGMVYKNGTTPFPSTFDVWKEMILSANSSLEIASFYWTLRDGDVSREPGLTKYPSSDKGEEIFAKLLEIGQGGKVNVKIVQSEPSKMTPNTDTEVLSKKKAAEVRSLNLPRLISGNGVLHTKLWIADRKTAYIGSANTDWRSLTQVKEMGIYIKNCTCLIEDLGKIFNVYWIMSVPDAKIPSNWPKDLSTIFNNNNPMQLFLNDTKTSVYLSSSPPELCPPGRENDGNSIVKTISKAEKFIYVAVMDYVPLRIYTPKPKFWPMIDNALRAAAIDQKVEVRLLISSWNHTSKEEKYFLQSIVDITNSFKNVKVSVKLFVVPSSADQSKIPYARVNHNKYMVTDNIAYIGTSNWSGDYFIDTAGVGVIIEGDTFIRKDLEDVFLRDWNSEFAHFMN
ncbi:phospholipase D3-like isoform X2 [Cimex lectularius]|uniref:PLD phosphodiesterase domain-containing protein n=1 Tax=Cimex lectularius TaxID=79782 RepID=A0A8I6RPA0_CIMLE|nr:phospholipase D3-like isoform X2 [Cimex lectularius]